MTPALPTLELQYRRNGRALPTVDLQLQELFRFAQALSAFSPLLTEWYLTSDKDLADALRYKAFDANGPTSAALAIVKTESKNVHDIRSVSVWNGAENNANAAVLSSRCNVLGRPDAFKFGLKLQPEVLDWKTGAQWMQAALAIWPADFSNFGPFWYAEKKVFKDRPGVSWMLYLPKILTIRQVPEARALVPVMGPGKKQIGTIIVSVTDERFSAENAAHVKIANDIEIRLVDQDLLPRYADL
ncbi:MAG: immunity 52 family protein [Pseudomonadota bacterium]